MGKRNSKWYHLYSMYILTKHFLYLCSYFVLKALKKKPESLLFLVVKVFVQEKLWQGFHSLRAAGDELNGKV